MRFQPAEKLIFFLKLMVNEALKDMIRKKKKIAALVHQKHVIPVRSAKLKGKKRISGHDYFTGEKAYSIILFLRSPNSFCRSSLT